MTDTVNCLQQELLGDSDTWGNAECFKNGGGEDTWDSAIRSAGDGEIDDFDSAFQPLDAEHSTLEMESSFLMRSGREPSNEEVMEYMEKHRLQVFLTDVIMHVAKHFPPDPFEFLLNHMEAMVMKYRAKLGRTDSDGDCAQSPSPGLGVPPVAEATPQQREKIVRHIVAVLQHEDMSGASAGKLYQRFAATADRMSLEDFEAAMKHLETIWGLQPQDTRYMTEKLKRWRFRSNAARGTRGLPLWPLTREDFLSAYPGMLRAVRDRYVPIGSQMHRSLFIRQVDGDVTDKYTIGAKLGQGAYGEVHLVTLKSTNEKRVCKRVGRVQSKVSEEDLVAEVNLMRGLDHPHIIRLFEFFEKRDCLEMILEPVFGGTLTHVVSGLYFADGSHLGRRPEALSETYLAKACYQLLSALEYAHEVAGVVHKDLKCDNVLMVGKPSIGVLELLKAPVHVMLADFGIAEVFSALPGNTMSMTTGEDAGEHMSMNSIGGTRALNFSRRSTNVGGTPSYMSPEMFRGSFSSKSDLWSLGVMVYQLMTGHLPYQGGNLLMQANIVCNPRRHPPWDVLVDYKWSLGARWFCQQLLSKDEAMRPSASEALRDNWVTKQSALHADEPPTVDERQALHRQHLQSHLMKMSLSCITSQLNLSQLQHMNLRFEKYDTGGDGRLSHLEMRQVLDDVGIRTAEDAELIIESLDSDHSGMIEYSEFVAGCLNVAADGMKQQLKVVFGIFDLDSSGTINKDELRQVLTEGPNASAVPTRPASPLLRPGSRTGEPGSQVVASTILPDGKTIDELLEEIDKDGKGTVDFAEFEAYLLAEHKKAGEKLNAEVAAQAAEAQAPATDEG